MKRLILLLVSASLFLTACGDDEKESQENVSVDTETEAAEVEEKVEDTERTKMMDSLVSKLETDQVFDVGSYIKGDIPEGVYAFISLDPEGAYYSEEDESGEIIENENFKTFGYVEVHNRGNLTTKGILVNKDVFGELGITGAKDLYEILNELDNHNGEGHYLIGTDIEPGEYIFESNDPDSSAYVSLTEGAVGSSEIIKNNNFDGRYSLIGSEGQYLTVSRSTFELK